MSRFALAATTGLHLGQVVDDVDPESRGRVKVKLAALELEVWAPVATLSAGNGYGVVALPKVDELVAVGFVEPELPIVLGSLFTGSEPLPPESTPHADRYSITTPAGTRVLLDDAESSKVEVRMKGGNVVTLSDDASSGLTVDISGTTVKVSSSGVEVNTGSNVQVQASQVSISASMVQVDAAMASFSGVVKANTLIAESGVVSPSYTPGAGNIW